MHYDYKRRIRRKLNAFRCISKRLRHTVRPANRAIGYVTVYHDFEGEYSLLTDRQTSLKGVTSLLEIERAFDINATYNIVGKLMLEVPKLITKIVAGGHEIASHSYSHHVMTSLNKDELAKDLQQSSAVFNALGLKLKGFRCPQSMWDFTLLKILLSHGVCWTAERDTARYPYIILKKNGKRLLRMPDTIDDWLYKSRNITPDQFYDILVSLVDSTAKKKNYASVGFHPWVQGEDERRLVVFDKFIKYLKEHPGIEIVTFGQMYNLCSDHQVN